MSKKKFSGNFAGKGYYIALILCAVAIGVSGYLYYRHADDNQKKLQNTPTNAVDVIVNDDVPATANQQSGDATTSPNEEQDAQKPVKLPEKRMTPLSGKTVADYCMETLSYNATTRDWRTHNGVDIAAEAGTKVCAAAAGTVYTVYDDETMGTTVVINHDGGYTTHYSSLAQEVSVIAGDEVKVGQEIGAVGATALLETAMVDHLHFAVSCNGKPVDPAEFLPED